MGPSWRCGIEFAVLQSSVGVPLLGGYGNGCDRSFREVVSCCVNSDLTDCQEPIRRCSDGCIIKAQTIFFPRRLRFPDARRKTAQTCAQSSAEYANLFMKCERVCVAQLDVRTMCLSSTQCQPHRRVTNVVSRGLH